MVHENQNIQNPPEDAPSKGVYGAMPSGYTIRPEGTSGAIPTGYAIPPPGYGALPQSYGAPLKGPSSAPPPPAYGAPLQQPIYVAPPPTCPCMRNDHCHTAHTKKTEPKKPESDCERFFTACCGVLLFCCIMEAIF